MAQSKVKNPKRVASTKRSATHLKMPEAVRKPANQLLANLTGVMGKELLAEALVTIAGVLVGGRYVRRHPGGDAEGASNNGGPLSASEVISRVVGDPQMDGGPKGKKGARKAAAKRSNKQESPTR